jgi:flagellar biosynthetic protein FliO
VSEPFATAVLRMGLWLCVLLGALYLLAWGAKRLGLVSGARPGSPDAIRVLSRMALDPRKSIVVVHVRDRVLVLGVTPSAINVLTEMDPDGSETAPAAGSSFSARLVRALGRSAHDRSAPAAH